MFFFAFLSPAYAQDYKNDLLKLSQSIRQTEKQKIDVENQLIALQLDYKNVSKQADQIQYDAVRSLHQYQSLNNTQYKHTYLLQDQSIFQRFFRLRDEKTKSEILKHQLNQNLETLESIHTRSEKIEYFLNKRKTLEQTLAIALKQVEDIQKSRMNDSALSEFQSLVDDLQEQEQSLNDFLKTILKIEKIDFTDEAPLIFSMPVSGVISEDNGRLMIKSAPSSLVITPARGKIIYADHFGNLGLVVIIHHGEGYMSVLRGLSSSYVNVGFDVIAGEPIGVLHGDKNNKDLNQAMLIYELRYNNILTNPLLKMTGL
jgi:murein DD-endopeptidase MepM/ murein hydrolase activator NlpD